MYKKIICPVDASRSSDCGMVESIHLAKVQNAKLLFLHVIDTYFPILDVSGDLNVVYIAETLRSHGKKILNNAENLAQAAGVNAQSKMAEALGSRASKIVLSQADDWSAVLIVMGTHGLRGMERLVIGSDAETVVRNTSVPVLLLINSLAASIT